jgi:hypothetical protein
MTVVLGDFVARKSSHAPRNLAAAVSSRCSK